MSRKKWIVNNCDKEVATLIAEELNLSPFAALIASARGIKNIEDAEEFFGINESVPADPFDFPDMYKAVKRIKTALDNFERIAVYGDYDADGVTATALLYSYLEMQGADVVFAVPNRHTEGYGLNYSAIDNISRMGAKLIITVDNGISAVEEAEYIRQLEMDLIVTDHHLPSDVIPDAVAVVDPHREDCILDFKDYAGVGVAYKLICALEGEENEVTESFLDLVTIGTVADVMPLKGENRSIVRRGTQLINDSDRVGIQALTEAAGLEGKTIKSGTVAFGIAPRINAAGRIGTADRAIRLLLSDDYDEATALATEINEDNVSRQQTEQEILNQAVEIIDANPSWKYDRVLVVSGENWHDGVIGIVASRLVEKYGKPTIVITESDDNTAKGSGRSVEGFSLYDALCACEDVLDHYGGHTLAAGLGLDIEKIPDLRRAINSYADGVEAFYPVQNIDFKINPSCVNAELLDVIDSLEPFGAGNPQPIFGLYNMTLTDITPIGSGKHLRLTFRRGETTLSAVLFRMTQLDFPYIAGDVVDVAATFEPNEYLGQIRLNILVRNIKLHDMDDNILFEEIGRFDDIMSGRNTGHISALPDRDFIARVYKFIRSKGKWRYDNEILCKRLGLKAEDYAKVCVAVEALSELGTLVRDGDGNFTLPQENIKVNLNDAPVLKRIKE
ncbi:MAG: single-stranded-DNA-specific exonuclease RecJ [Acutalibacteraceae bacterium]|nr:single-stranded-DNA-specific exonuclease RecJ [Acutalibacteraceae bacterium]